MERSAVRPVAQLTVVRRVATSTFCVPRPKPTPIKRPRPATLAFSEWQASSTELSDLRSCFVGGLILASRGFSGVGRIAGSERLPPAKSG